MTITVLFFAYLRDAAQAGACELTLEAPARGLEARAALLERFCTLDGLLDSCRLAVNGEYRSWETTLSPGDELCLIPPVSGG